MKGDKYIILNGKSAMSLTFKGKWTDELGWNVPRGGILMIDDFATEFSTRRAATAAIKRTLKFAEKMHFPWGSRYDFEIVPVRKGAR